MRAHAHAHPKAHRHTIESDWLDPRCSPRSPAFCGSWTLPPVRLFWDVFPSVRLNSPAVTKATCRKKKAKKNNFIPPATPDALGQKWNKKKKQDATAELQWLKYPSWSSPPRSLSPRLWSRSWPPHAHHTPLLVWRPLRQRNWHFPHVVTRTRSFILSHFIASLSLQLTVTLPQLTKQLNNKHSLCWEIMRNLRNFQRNSNTHWWNGCCCCCWFYVA